MNVLVLTPDRVGSTFLQRYLTIIMQGYDYGKPVINLHELTNGILKYYNEHHKQEVIGKPPKDEWGYHQKLSDVVDVLKSGDHYKTSRLALYHILNRQDSLTDQLSFYKYLNDNFYIISARRANLFEHSISWCITSESKSLNVFSHEEKIKIFNDVYKRRIHVDTEVMTNYLDRYMQYLDWVENHFNVSTYFNYEKDMPNIDSFVSRLNIFPPEQQPITWKDMFGIDWKDWNNCHYLISDMSGLSTTVQQIGLTSTQPKLLENITKINESAILNNSIPLPALLKRDSLSVANQQFLQANIQQYGDAYYRIADMEEKKILTSKMPIKLQTLAEKAMLIKNFPECIDAYNRWCDKNQNSKHLSGEDLLDLALTELKGWYNTD
jgi:hypothetical protein